MGRAFVAASVVLVVSVVHTGLAIAQQKDCLRIGSSFGEKHSIDDQVAANIRDALVPFNICVEIVPGPSRRLTEELLRGLLDGELFRVKEYGQSVAGAAILVDEPMSDVMGYLVASADVDLDSTPIGSLKLGILRGVRWHEVASSDATDIVVANDMEQLLSMLRHGRVDGIMIGGFLRSQYPELALLPAKVVYRSTAHFVLHRSRADLAAPIESAIRAFKARGCSFILPSGGPACGNFGTLEELRRQDHTAALRTLKPGGSNRQAAL